MSTRFEFLSKSSSVSYSLQASAGIKFPASHTITRDNISVKVTARSTLPVKLTQLNDKDAEARMAPPSATTSLDLLSKRIDSSVTAGYDLSAKLYRVLQVLPSAVCDYGCFGSQVLYLASNLEQINNVLPTLTLTPEKLKVVLGDLEKLLGFTDEAYVDIKDALPHRPFDGAEVDLMLPLDVPALQDQIEALQIGATMIMAIFQLAASRPVGENLMPSSNRFNEAIVNQLKKIIRDLKCTQPKENKRRGPSLKRAKAHRQITEFLDEMLKIVPEEKEMLEVPGEKEDQNAIEKVEKKTKKAKKNDDSDSDSEDDDPIEADDVKLEHYGAHPKEDGMPDYIRHNPDNVYAKVPVKDVDTRSLIYYNLPYSKAKENNNYYIIWKPMEPYEIENVFQHTKKLRINEEHANIDPKLVVKSLMTKWLGVEIEVEEEVPTSEWEELEKNLAELRAQDEKRTTRVDRPYNYNRSRSYSVSPPPRRRVPYRPHVPYYNPTPYFGPRGLNTSKTEYWRSWQDQPQTLNSALKSYGWQPVYMRGTDEGQTWYFGQEIVHIRRFTDEYTPNEGPERPGMPDIIIRRRDEDDSEDEDKKKKKAKKQDQKPVTDLKEYLIIGTEWIEEEALHRHGFQYQVLPSGHYSLDPRLTWADIETTIFASSSFREERLYRKFRAAEKGDLSGPQSLNIPDMDYLNGTSTFEKPTHPRRVPSLPNNKHVPHKLETMPEEPAENVFKRKQEVQTPGAESHDSFVEVSK